MYWMQVLRSLAEPVSYLRPLDPVNMKDPHWWLGGGSDRLPVVPDGEIQTLLGREHVRRVAAFCQEGMDRFYEGVALLSGKPHATYFAEKFQTDPVTSALVQELYPEGREVFLVRDFRDVLCSIIAFSSSRNIGHAFGRDRTANDEEYVSVLKQSAARLLDDWRRRGESSHLLRYEDLVLRPEKTLQQLLEYLEVEADDETASVTLDAAKSERSQQLQRRHQTSESAEASIGRWRTDLSPSLQSAADEAFREMLDELGYPPNDAAPSTAGAQGAG